MSSMGAAQAEKKGLNHKEYCNRQPGTGLDRQPGTGLDNDDQEDSTGRDWGTFCGADQGADPPGTEAGQYRPGLGDLLRSRSGGRSPWN
ncbi:hypothetical protein ACOMHN_022844 [Nucella lapillus]